ncbi:cytochrome c oxidase accessory protein CcoG [Chitinilyticum litopenaei]|uniref:cytochrome c oxidase accessory protein CcoG n=1 Tax=Chitinilyticum litopenaei TaxID=1121276 RepID=UPI0004197B76|nr:cytochrome c oxidase accessory protein CcoG [Chitinilyticum litopenaei]
MPAARTIPIHPAPGSATALQPRLTRGRFNNWRVALIVVTQAVFFGLPWLNWDGRQAVLFDVARQQFFVFGLNFWPQDFIYLAALLMACAFLLFWASTLAGRVWCGYACPQTVYSTLMLWLDRLVEGNHIARARLAARRGSSEWLARKGVKHALMLLLCAWIGVTFLGWFVPLREVVARLPAGLTALEWGWIAGYGGFTYVLAGHLREQVCKHMCPYARFQASMFDARTLVVDYDSARGEPRGALRKAASAQGACVDCGICVQVCPVGIDIRQGLQYECIGCAACIDACDIVMDKLGQPRGLIRFSSDTHRQQPGSAAFTLRDWLRPRASLYAVLLLTVTLATGIALMQRQPFKLDVARDRQQLARETADGQVENRYLLQLGNSAGVPQDVELQLQAPPGIRLLGTPPVRRIDAGGNAQWALTLTAPAGQPSSPITLIAQSRSHPDWRVRTSSRFIGLPPR